MKGRTWQRVLRNWSQQVSWNGDTEAFLNSLQDIGQMFYDKTASSLRDSSLVAYPVHSVLIDFSEAYKQWLVRSRHNLVAFHPVKWAVKHQISNIELAGIKESLYGYSLSAVVEVRD